MKRYSLLLFLPVLLLASCGKSRPRGNATASYTLEPDTAQLRRQWGERSERFTDYRDRLLKESQDIIASRLKEYGFSDDEAEVKLADGRIHVSLKNTLADEKENARLSRLISSGGSLDVWETYNNDETIAVLATINNLLDSVNAAAREKSGDTLPPGGGSLIDEAKARREQEAEEKKHTNMLFTLLTPNFSMDPKTYRASVVSPVIARASAKDTARIGRYFRQENVRALIPHNMVFAWQDEGNNANTTPGVLSLLALKSGSMGKPAMQAIELQQVETTKSETGGWMINLEMKPGYSETWQRLTKANTGRGLAMVFSGKVLCCPTVAAEIPGGKMGITGNFTTDEAKDIALMLKASALPVNFRIVEAHVQ